jgi:hypothetical protein
VLVPNTTQGLLLAAAHRMPVFRVAEQRVAAVACLQ